MTEPTCFHFADFALYPGRRALLRNGTPVEIGSRAMDVLLALVRRHGEVATKSAIMADVWPGTVVEENNLTTQIATVRRVLGGASGDIPGADPGGSRFILTIPGRGYRFIADVIAVTAEDPAQETAPVPERPQDTERTNLPLQSSSFIGRERELAEIRARLGTRALVTLVGAGGVGKTRTALQLAAGMVDQFADGVFLLELAPLADGNLVAESLCRLLGVPATGDRPPEAVAIAMLRHKAMLLVLDNCEHVLEGAASLVAAILRHCPQLRILATSREALSISGESVFLMPSLAVPSVSPTLTAAVALRSDAVRLFAERAADALGTYTLSDEDAQAVATICRRLDGVPLATELAAARLRMLNPSEIAARLENVFRLLTGGSRTALPRQQTLRATIDWSFSLLSPQEQIVLRRLAVFPDGCSADGATAVAGGDGIDPDEVFDLVSALVAKSLMVADSGSKTTRYRMLETTRQYATEKLRQAGEADRERRKAEYLLAFFRRAEAAWPTMGTDAWLAAFGPETENLRCAIDWAFSNAGTPDGTSGLGIALVAASGAVSEEMSLQADLRRWTQTAMAHLTDATPPGEAAQVIYLFTLQQKRLGAVDVPAERLRAIELFRAAGDRLGLSRALRQTAIARAMPGDTTPGVLDMLAEAVALIRHLAPHKDLATALAHTGSVYFLNADHETSRTLNQQALSMRQLLGDRSGVIASAVNLAELLFLDGDTEAALAYATQAEAEARNRNAQSTLALILSNMAGYRLACGDAVAGAAAAAESLALSRAIGQDYLAVMCLEHLALALALTGRTEPAASLLGFADRHYAATGQTRERLEQAGHDRLIAALARDLPPAKLGALRAEGATWSTEQADAAAQMATRTEEAVTC